jgi:UDP:flavonoid glycosyltransferase YjiC (YdhE family)
LLPRAAALVHHGGIGTCAQGLSCGLPQLVKPMAYDQLDNGLRLKRLGVGEVVSHRKFTPRRVAAALSRLLDDAAVRDRAAHWAARCDGAASLQRACELLEQLPRAAGAAAQRQPAATH